MQTTRREQIATFLRSRGNLGATNADIVSHTGIKPHTSVFQVTQAMLASGDVKASRFGGIWHFVWRKEIGHMNG